MAAVIGALRVDLGLNSANFTAGLKNAQNGMKNLGNTIRQGAVVAAAAAAAIGGALTLAVKGTIDAADDMSKAAQSIGVPIEELSRLKYAADLSGVAFEGLQGSIGRLSRNMRDAANGTGTAGAAFSQLGIDIANADGTLKSSSDVLAQIADALAGMPDGAEKTALAMELMGRSGADMIPMLNQGSAALKSMMAEADSFGQVFTAEMGANAEAFNDNISRLQGAFAGITAELTANLLPALTSFSDWMVTIAAGFRDLSPQAQNAITILGGMTIAFAALAIPLGAVALAVGTLGAPVVAAAAAIAGLTAAVVLFWPEISKLGEVLGAFAANEWALFLQGWDAITTKVGEVTTVISDFTVWIVEAFAALPGQMLAIGGQIIQGLADGINAKWEEVKAGIMDIPGNIAGGFTDFFQIKSPSRLMQGIGSHIMEGLGNGMSSMAGQVSSIAEDIAGTVGGAFRDVISGAKSVGEAIGDVLASVAELVINQGFQMLFGGGMGGGMAGANPLSGILSSLFGFARGGSILPGGSGGIDSQLVQFRKSPNERVDITKPGQSLDDGGKSLVIQQTFPIQGAISDKTVLGMVQQGAASAVEAVKQQFPGWQANMQIHGAP